jgi:hypothetical protein
MDGKVIFEGEGPFHLPAVQSATARDGGGIVLVTLHVIAPGQGPTPVPIQTAMTFRKAQELAAALTDAALKIELGK